MGCDDQWYPPIVHIPTGRLVPWCLDEAVMSWLWHTLQVRAVVLGRYRGGMVVRVHTADRLRLQRHDRAAPRYARTRAPTPNLTTAGPVFSESIKIKSGNGLTGLVPASQTGPSDTTCYIYLAMWGSNAGGLQRPRSRKHKCLLKVRNNVLHAVRM